MQLRFLSSTFIHSQKKSSTFIISIKPLKEVQKKKKVSYHLPTISKIPLKFIKYYSKQKINKCIKVI